MRISDWSSDVCSSDLEMFEIRRVFRLAMHRDGVRHARRRRILCMGRPGQEEQQGSDQRCAHEEIGRASCRERVCQCVSISVGAVSLKKKITVRVTIIQYD